MPNEKQLDLLREGKIPISFNDNGMPTYAATAPLYELRMFIVALARGYMHLYNRVQIMEQWNRTVARKHREEQAS